VSDRPTDGDVSAGGGAGEGMELPGHDRVLDERGSRCPLPIVSLARLTNADPLARVLLLADDPAAASDVPAWCALRGRRLAWTGPAPDGRGTAYLVVAREADPA
jgi:tRNA 2-thiouridine synthesizing protein A